MADMPNEYTPCEEYRGYVIAVSHGVYSAFKDNKRIAIGGTDTREQLRRKIDRLY